MDGQTILQQRKSELTSPLEGERHGRRHVSEISPLPKADGREFYEPLTKPRQLKPVYIKDIDTRRHKKVALAVKMAYLWAERKRAGYEDISLILSGDNGTGKTHIARAIWWSMVQLVTDSSDKPIEGYQPQPVGKFYMSNELLGLMGNSCDPVTGILTPASPHNVIGTPPMVVIDDLGAEQIIPFVHHDDQEEERQARLFKVVDYCYARQISIIITTNLEIEAFKSFVGRRSWDRLVQMAPRLPNGDSFIVDMFGVPSYRLESSGR